MNEGKKPEQKQYKLIENMDQFSERINDIKSQISGFKMASELGFDIKQIKESKKTLMTFKECMESFGEKLSPELEEDKNCKELISFYNGLVQRLKTFQTTDELKNIIEDYKKGPENK